MGSLEEKQVVVIGRVCAGLLAFYWAARVATHVFAPEYMYSEAPLPSMARRLPEIVAGAAYSCGLVLCVWPRSQRWLLRANLVIVLAGALFHAVLLVQMLMGVVGGAKDPLSIPAFGILAAMATMAVIAAARNSSAVKPNHPLDATVGAVTGLASARPAPAPPASQSDC